MSLDQSNSEPSTSDPVATWLAPKAMAQRLAHSCPWIFVSLAWLYFANYIDWKAGDLDLQNILKNSWLPGLVFCFGLLVYRVKEVQRFETHEVALGFGARLRETALWLFAGFVFFLTALIVLLVSDTPSRLWPAVLPPLLLIGFGSYIVIRKTRTVLTPNGLAAQESINKSAAVPPPSNVGVMTNDGDDWLITAKWWVRYPMAIGLAAVGWYFAFGLEKKWGWVIAVLFWFGAAGLMREVFLFALGAGLLVLIVWVLGVGIAALPISAAIIIGAVIIAVAVKR
jgi:hypothetical protein